MPGNTIYSTPQGEGSRWGGIPRLGGWVLFLSEASGVGGAGVVVVGTGGIPVILDGSGTAGFGIQCFIHPQGGVAGATGVGVGPVAF